jgi:outer membrane murein-binding lipoprotein Lpp
MRRLSIAMSALAGAALIAGCAGGAKPRPAAPAVHHVSAASACRDFEMWFLANNSNILAGNDGAILHRAVSESPSGQLYEDMNTLRSDVATAAAAQGDLQSAEKGMTVNAAYAVEQDCQSVNPSS